MIKTIAMQNSFSRSPGEDKIDQSMTLTIVNRLNHLIVSEAGVREFASPHICNANKEALCL